MLLKVKSPFKDKESGELLQIGKVIEVSAERAAELLAVNGGAYVEKYEEAVDAIAEELPEESPKESLEVPHEKLPEVEENTATESAANSIYEEVKAAEIDEELPQMDDPQQTQQMNQSQMPSPAQYNAQYNTQAQVPYPTDDGPYSGLGIAGFVVSIVSVIIGWALFVVPVVGLVLSAVGLSDIKKYNKKGHGMALAGVIISIVMLVIAVLILICYAVSTGIAYYSLFS